MRILFTKAGIVDDASPSAANPASLAGRAFGIPAAYDYAKVQPTGSMLLGFEFLDANNAVVAGVTANAQLWLCDMSTPERPFWYRAGGVQSVATGQAYTFPVGTLDKDGAIAFLQITGVSGGAPAVVVVRGAASVSQMGLTYTAAGRTLSDGDISALRASITGGLLVSMIDDVAGEYRTGRAMMTAPRALSDSEGAASTLNSGALATSVIVKASPGRLFKLRVGNSTAGVAGWIMVLDSATLPGNGATPKWRRQIGAVGAEVSEDWSALGGLYCAAGIVVALSTTEATLTLGAATILVDPAYS